MIDINDFYEEHQAEKAAQLEAEEKAKAERIAAEQTKWAEQAQAERIARAKFLYTFRLSIADQIKANDMKATVEVEETSHKFLVNGIDCSTYFSFDEERSHQSRWRSRSTGKTRIVVGEFGSRTSYPQRKDGGHNYTEIARSILGYAESILHRRRVEAAKGRNATAVANLKSHFGLESYDDVISASVHPEQQVVLDLKKLRYASVQMKPETAKEVLEFLISKGFKAKLVARSKRSSHSGASADQVGADETNSQLWRLAMTTNQVNPIFSKIKKLLALADASKNSSEAEAQAAALKVQELLQEHNLSLAQIEAEGGTTDEVREKEQSDRKAMYNWQVVLMQSLADNNFCLHHVKPVQEFYRGANRRSKRHLGAPSIRRDPHLSRRQGRRSLPRAPRGEDIRQLVSDGDARRLPRLFSHQGHLGGQDHQALKETTMNTTSKNDLNDDLSDLLGTEARPTQLPSDPELTRIRETVPEFVETCPKCRGTGRFISWSGRDCGPCFACKGRGSKTFRSSPEQRVQSRERAAQRKIDVEQENWATFVRDFPDEAAWIERKLVNPSRNERFQEMVASFKTAVKKFGDLSQGRLDVVRNGMRRDAEWTAKREAQPQRSTNVDASKIVQAMQNGKAQGLIWITLRFDGIVMKEAKKYPGTLYVLHSSKTDGYGKKLYLGKIVDGIFLPNSACTDEDLQKVVTICADPLAAAQVYGNVTNSCCVCGRTLTNKESVELGIGPICGDRMGWTKGGIRVQAQSLF